jgi:hypothetical protein
MRLRRLAVVKLEQAAEPLTTVHLACSHHRRRWRDELVVQTLVRPFFMIVVDKFSYGLSEMLSFAKMVSSFTGETIWLKL